MTVASCCERCVFWLRVAGKTAMQGLKRLARVSKFVLWWLTPLGLLNLSLLSKGSALDIPCAELKGARSPKRQGNAMVEDHK